MNNSSQQKNEVSIAFRRLVLSPRGRLHRWRYAIGSVSIAFRRLVLSPLEEAQRGVAQGTILSPLPFGV